MAERSIFKGAISLGGFVIPMKITKATSEHDVAFHEYHAKDLGRVGRSKPCKTCGDLLSGDDIVKGVEISKGSAPVTFSKDELEQLPLSSAKEIEIDRFVGAEELSPLMFEQAYYVLPEGNIGLKAYEWFVRGLKKQHKVAIGKIALRQREHICAIAPHGNGLILNTMLYADEIREMPQPPKAQVTDDEVEILCQVIGKFSKPFDHKAYADNYTNAIQAMIDAKLEGKELPTVQAKEAGQNLEEALKNLL